MSAAACVPARDYQAHFDRRGGAYDRAMRSQPGARAAEFAQVLARAALAPGMTVADVPAGGGYLARWLPAGCTWLGHEPCATFTPGGGGHGAAVTGRPLLPLPWDDASVDVALSVAGVHHLPDVRPLLLELRRVVVPGGRLVLSDVAEASAVACFLDDFVGRCNSTGHQGWFLGPHTLRALRETGWDTLSHERVSFHWAFDDRAALDAFCRDLFDLCRCAPGEAADAAEAMLGTERLADGRLGLRWQLMTLVARRPPACS